MLTSSSGSALTPPATTSTPTAHPLQLPPQQWPPQYPAVTTGWVLLRLWLLAQVTLVAGAWLLSPFKLLTPAGYFFLTFVIFAWGLIEWKRSGINAARVRLDFRNLLRRLRRPLPMTMAIMWIISLVGGLAWLSTYADSLSYRLPRTMHWIAEKQWHWIPSDDRRVNVVGLNLEFTWIPFLMLFKGDRMLFLLNLVAYSFLPGVFFSFLRGMRIGGRAAWYWMWILPGGYVFAMQAASLGGDAYAGVIALACMAFAFRARRGGDVTDAWCSILTAGFLTGIKQVVVPFGLVWLPGIIPCLSLLRRRLGGTLATVLIAALVSFIPVVVANAVYTESWKGFSKAELRRWETDSAFWGIIGGVFSVTTHNLAPPIFPQALKWNEAMNRFTSTTQLGSHFRYDVGLALMQVLISEHTASLGVGIVLLLLITRLAARGKTKSSPAVDWTIKAIRWLPFVAMLVFLAKSSVSFNPRYVAPYYPFMLPAFLATYGVAAVTRRLWWRRLSVFLNVVTIGLLVLSRQRPLWPVFAVADWAKRVHPNSESIAKACAAYTVTHRTRMEVFPQIQASIPKSEKVVGYAVSHNPYLEMALWFPMGKRKVIRVNASDTAETLRQQGIKYVLVDPSVFYPSPEQDRIELSIEEWQAKYRGKVMAQFEASLSYQYNSWVAYVVRLDD